MKLDIKPVVCALAACAALISPVASWAAPTCASPASAGMSITGPGAATATAATDCMAVSGIFNQSKSTFSSISDFESFTSILATTWGGIGSDWVYLGERSDADSGSPLEAFGYILNFTSPVGTSPFEVDLATDPNAATQESRLDIVAVLLPSIAGQPWPALDLDVLAYLAPGVDIAAGTLAGSFDFADPSFAASGVRLYGRLADATNPGGGGNNGGQTPEPGALALVFGAGAAIAFVRRRRSV